MHHRDVAGAGDHRPLIQRRVTLWRHGRLLELPPQELRQGLRLVRVVQPREGMSPGDPGDRSHRNLFGRLHRVDQVFARCQLAVAAQLADRKKEGHENRVDERGGRLEEVVVVGGEELAELVDEQAESHPSDDRGDEL